MIPKSFGEISKPDIDTLVENGAPEGRTLDYKRYLPGTADEDKREFLADVSSFANAAGGDIIYGVAEENGIPTAAAGVPEVDTDAEILRLDNMIRTGIDPRVPSVQIKAVAGFSTGPVIILRIPQSWSSPHMVTFKNLSRFFSRTNRGKFQMDTSEIRSAFLLSEAVPDRMKRFRDDRLAKIVACETPLPMEPGPKIVLHVLPIQSFAHSTTVDVVALEHSLGMLPPMSTSGWDGRMNVDGFVAYWMPRDQPCYSYTQLFRTGAIEAVDGFCIHDSIIPSADYELQIIRATTAYLKLLDQLAVAPPFVVILSMLGVKGVRLAHPPRSSFRRIPPLIDRDVLSVPEVVVDSVDEEPTALLKPVFDTIWQAAGFPRCANYNEEGKWSPR